MLLSKLILEVVVYSNYILERRDDEYLGIKVLEMQLPGKRKRGRQNRYLDEVKECMTDRTEGRLF